MLSRLAAILLLAISSSCIMTLVEQTLTTKRETYPAEGITSARLETGAGSLIIRGRRGGDMIEVTAEYKGRVASENEAQKVLDNLKLTMEVRGSTYYLKTEQLQKWDFGNSGRINLDIVLPTDVALDVEDSSGSISITGIENDIQIVDGSGSIDVNDISGNLTVDDGSGSIDVRNIERNVKIDDGSGGIEVTRVRGNVKIEDGSGSINVEDVLGDLTVPEDGSGSLRYRDIQGRIDVPRKK